MKRAIRLVMLLLACGCISWQVQAADDLSIPHATGGQTQMKPWQMVLFTIPGCSSCITMRDQVIEPLMELGKIQPIQFTEVVQHSDADWYYIRGLGHQQIRDLKKRYQTSLFPTLVFLDMQGNKIADNVVGVTSVEHYRTKLTQIIDELNNRDYAKSP